MFPGAHDFGDSLIVAIVRSGIPTILAVITLRMSMGDLGRMRFAYSALVEAAESIYMLSSGLIQAQHVRWFRDVRDRLRTVDMALLCAVIPRDRLIANFFFDGAVRRSTNIEDELHVLSDMPAKRLGDDLARTWPGHTMPPQVRDLLGQGSAAPRQLAETVYDYWRVALESHWSDMRAVLDDDVAFRAGRLINGGAEALLADLHPDVVAQGDMIAINRRSVFERDLEGAGLTLVPSIFAWPACTVSFNDSGPAKLVYGARGVARLWQPSQPPGPRAHALGELVGRTRAAILAAVAAPRSTTELAGRLGYSLPSVSQHLAILRRSGLVASWRSGRHVLYQRTPMATSLVEAASSSSNCCTDDVV